MSYHEEKEYSRRLSLGYRHNALIMLISINLILFVVLAFIMAVCLRYRTHSEALAYFNAEVLSWFALPADAGRLAARPWTLVTHMFAHTDVWRVLGNMLWLWTFGYILQDLTGNRKLFPVFLYGGLAGALAFILSVHLIPSLRPEVPEAMTWGASAGIMAIAAAATTLAPHYRIFPMLNGGIPVWIITAVYLVIDMAGISSGDTAGHIVHLAGALAGFLFIWLYRKGYDGGAWINNTYDWFINLFNPEKPKKGKTLRKELFYKAGTAPYHRVPNLTEKRVNEILEKISERGYNALTEEEKDLLKKASKEDF